MGAYRAAIGDQPGQKLNDVLWTKLVILKPQNAPELPSSGARIGEITALPRVLQRGRFPSRPRELYT